MCGTVAKAYNTKDKRSEGCLPPPTKGDCWIDVLRPQTLYALSGTGGGGWGGAQLHLPVHTAEIPDPVAALSELRTLVTLKLTTGERVINHVVNTR